MINKMLPKPPASNVQVQEYVSAVRKGLNSLFVVETEEGWTVHPASKPGKGIVFASTEDALKYAKEKAELKQSQIYIFDLNGALLEQ